LHAYRHAPRPGEACSNAGYRLTVVS